MAEQYPFPQQRGASTTPPVLPHVCSGKTRPPHFPTPCTIEWAALRDVELLRHGTGTSLYTATFRGDAVVVKTPAVWLKAQATFDVVGPVSPTKLCGMFFLPDGVVGSKEFPIPFVNKTNLQANS